MDIKKILAFLFFLCSLATGYSSVNDSLKISLITCSPGSQVYELFGHTGLRVQDVSRNVDVVFHYGVFSFNTPHFIYRFTKGETDYSIGLADFRDFVYNYAVRGSKVSELPLELTAEESKRVFQALIINNMPDNRIYRYNFLYDNCATRPRNVITENLSGQIQYKNPDEKVTFREMIHDCTHNYPWLTFGIDLALGAPLDRTISYEEQMFLPDVLMGAFEDARVVKGDSVRYLSGEPVLLLAADTMRMTSATVRPTGISPLFAASLLLSVVGYNFCRRNYKTSSLPYCRYGFVFDLRVGRVSIVLLDVYIYPSGYLSELFGILGKSFFIDITCNHLGKIYEKGRLLLSFY